MAVAPAVDSGFLVDKSPPAAAAEANLPELGLLSFFTFFLFHVSNIHFGIYSHTEANFP